MALELVFRKREGKLDEGFPELSSRSPVLSRLLRRILEKLSSRQKNLDFHSATFYATRLVTGRPTFPFHYVVHMHTPFGTEYGTLYKTIYRAEQIERRKFQVKSQDYRLPFIAKHGEFTPSDCIAVCWLHCKTKNQKFLRL